MGTNEVLWDIYLEWETKAIAAASKKDWDREWAASNVRFFIKEIVAPCKFCERPYTTRCDFCGEWVCEVCVDGNGQKNSDGTVFCSLNCLYGLEQQLAYYNN